MDANEEVPKDIKRTIIKDELQLWKNTAWQCGLRARIARKAEDKQREEMAIADGLRAEKNIDLLEAELKALDAPEDIIVGS